jgi:hypothetical protein
MKTQKEYKDIVKIFLLIDEEEIKQAERKIKYIKSYKPRANWRNTKYEGM